MIQNVEEKFNQQTDIDRDLYIETQNGKNHEEERRRIHYMFFMLQWGSPLYFFLVYK